ncbi:GTP-binding protein gtr2 [Elasticomyces elasticus]|nr:GTP-binding protein gtr2 [Elasticomyces elasticus]
MASGKLDGFTPASQLTLMRYLQGLHEAEPPSSPNLQARYHTGRLPNGRHAGSKPRLMLMGQKRSGKSSISSVVFHKMPPSETLYLETTTAIQSRSLHSFMDFQVAELPGHLDYFNPEFDQASIFGDIGALIWVIDAQDEYLDAINQLNSTIIYLSTTYPAINIEIFVHKVDGLSEDYKNDTFRDIIQRVQDELSDAGYENPPVSFYQTSIYNHTIFEAISKVIQKLIPQLPALESLLNSLCSSCRIEKAFLFDIPSKIYVATDTSPTDTSSYEVCSDYIDVIVDLEEIYGWDRSVENGYPMEERDETGNGDSESLVTMEKKGHNYLYLKEINRYLALICLMGEDSPAEKKVLIDYNVGVFQEAIEKIFPRNDR